MRKLFILILVIINMAIIVTSSGTVVTGKDSSTGNEQKVIKNPTSNEGAFIGEYGKDPTPYEQIQSGQGAFAKSAYKNIQKLRSSGAISGGKSAVETGVENPQQVSPANTGAYNLVSSFAGGVNKQLGGQQYIRVGEYSGGYLLGLDPRVEDSEALKAEITRKAKEQGFETRDVGTSIAILDPFKQEKIKKEQSVVMQPVTASVDIGFSRETNLGSNFGANIIGFSKETALSEPKAKRDAFGHIIYGEAGESVRELSGGVIRQEASKARSFEGQLLFGIGEFFRGARQYQSDLKRSDKLQENVIADVGGVGLAGLEILSAPISLGLAGVAAAKTKVTGRGDPSTAAAFGYAISPSIAAVSDAPATSVAITPTITAPGSSSIGAILGVGVEKVANPSASYTDLRGAAIAGSISGLAGDIGLAKTPALNVLGRLPVSGQTVNLAFKGATSGGVAGGAFEVGSQISRGQNLDLGRVAATTAIGAGAGAILLPAFTKAGTAVAERLGSQTKIISRQASSTFGDDLFVSESRGVARTSTKFGPFSLDPIDTPFTSFTEGERVGAQGLVYEAKIYTPKQELTSKGAGLFEVGQQGDTLFGTFQGGVDDFRVRGVTVETPGQKVGAFQGRSQQEAYTEALGKVLDIDVVKPTSPRTSKSSLDIFVRDAQDLLSAPPSKSASAVQEVIPNIKKTGFTPKLPKTPLEVSPVERPGRIVKGFGEPAITSVSKPSTGSFRPGRQITVQLEETVIEVAPGKFSTLVPEAVVAPQIGKEVSGIIGQRFATALIPGLVGPAISFITTPGTSFKPVEIGFSRETVIGFSKQQTVGQSIGFSKQLPIFTSEISVQVPQQQVFPNIQITPPVSPPPPPKETPINFTFPAYGFAIGGNVPSFAFSGGGGTSASRSKRSKVRGSVRDLLSTFAGR